MTHATLAKILLTAVVAVGGGGFLVYSSLDATHYMMVDELLAQGLDKWTEKEIKVHGQVVAGTLAEAIVDNDTQRTFVLEKAGKKIRVFAHGIAPDAFNGTADVVATGQLIDAKTLQARADAICHGKPLHEGASLAACPVHSDSDQMYVVDASELAAKCPSKYDGGPTQTIDTKYR